MKTALVLCSVFLLATPVFAADPAWIKVESPHFTVISDGNEKQARDVALGFERIQGTITTILPKLRTESGSETIVLAARDERTMKTLVSVTSKGSAVLAGMYHKGWEKDYAVIRLDMRGENKNTIYHEYVHKLLHLNFTRLPVWVDEGLAEFYGNTGYQQNRVIIGNLSPRINMLRSKTLLPIRTFLDPKFRGRFSSDGDQMLLFYAQAWGLTHFLMFGDGMNDTRKMSEFLILLQEGTPQIEAFEKTFGNPDDVQKLFDEYVRRFAFRVFYLNKAVAPDASSFAAERMSAAQTSAMLGGYYLYWGEPETAGERLTAALAQDPKSALAHENQGLLHFHSGDEESAKKEFELALTLEPNRYLSRYYQTMLTWETARDTESLAKLEKGLRDVLALNARFAPAWVALSRVLARQNKLPDALKAARQAQQLEPDRAGYHTNVSALLLRLSDYRNASRLAEAVATRWGGPDSAEALSVVERARKMGKLDPTPEETEQEAEHMKYAADTTAVAGTITAMNCDSNKLAEVKLQAGDKILTFRASKLQGMGWSDTIWFGGDHFTACHHNQGRRAVVRYIEAADASQIPEIKWVEIRDDLFDEDPASKF